MKTQRPKLIGIIGLILILIALIMVWFGKITMTDFCLFAGVLASILTILGNYFSKDAKASSLDKGVAEKVNKLYRTEKPE